MCRWRPKGPRIAGTLAVVLVTLVAASGPIDRAAGGIGGEAEPVGRSSATGIAVVRWLIRVNSGVAVLVVTCHQARCGGVAKLNAQVGPPPPDRTPGDPGREILIGKAAFAIAAETTVTLRIALNREGRSLMRRAKRSGRYVNLAGHGLRNRTVLLKRVRRLPPP